ncbi:A disintegrin and metalloproteinase with thrombospondin motifs 9 isoform X1 [Temnothorax curvispinosus]|uniref:A disintegrin and metalloproteinase with thrombospondin motifs 9 isoform X1 n=1 Tax=Temnothorax curvispinosus TaxID=300111 RepID=A0A6J1PFH9_9HYME|nr:A disintegrin and metalloproteinase with thrombospondin motifs 9 isoform X1 [Temnothorax curvispinosus]
MSRISNRVATIGAALAIVLLVILLVILWSDVRNVDRIENLGRIRKNSTIDGVVNETRRKQIDGLRRIATTDLVTTFESIEQNLTNEVLPEGIRNTKEFNGTSSIDMLPSAKGNLEYVKPLKISQNQYEDPPEQFSTAKRHHSGHFRHATAEVWDPHPQYEFTAFGRRFRLRLAHDASFVSPDIKVTHMSENTTRREHAGHHLGCFYSGSVDGDPSSAVSVSLCHGMTGHMKTSMGSYFIKPTEHWREDDKDSLGSSLQHALYRVPTAAINLNDDFDTPENGVRSRNCGVIDYDSDDIPSPLTDDSSARKVYVGERSRERRSLTRKTASLERFPREKEEEYERFTELTEHRQDFFQRLDYDDRYYSVAREHGYQNEEYAQDSEMDADPFVTWRPRRALPREYFIEIMVVADAKMVEYHGTGLVSYILVLMSTVSRIYKDQSIGNPVSIAVMKIVKTEEVFGVKHSGSDGIAAAEMLKRFCQWQKHNNPDEPSPEHHDAALLLTRENLCHNPRQKRCDTLGLAELGRMCSPGSSCAIVQDNGLAAAFTIAHEIGHVLNMPHDDDAKCTGFRNRSGVHNVMSRMLDDNTFPWEWSKCSRHYVTEFLEAGYANCLLDEPSKMMERQNGRLPGEDYSENKQCELVFGQGSRICPHMVSDGQAVCRRLWCTAPLWDHHQQCHTQHMPWADGTPCGIDKWCHRGECVSRRNLEPVHGQWGEWGRYGECSRTCGGGVKRKYRECDNPAPKNGGNYCIGERVKYRNCGTRECPPGSPDFREQQCSKFDNNNFNIQNLARDVKWHAKYTRILPQDRCKLYCQVESNQYYMLRDKVIDGTPCGPDTFHICVNGQCKPAGCDHVLNSTAELDTCGVCRGDNATCQRIAGAYNSSVYGYTRVAKIPAGSSYIDIKQHGWLGSHNDSNYLALRIGEDGEYILNGNFMVMHRKVIVHAGVTIEYSGPESVVERLNSSRPIATDLILEVLSVGNVYPPQITYEYTVPKGILNSYTWLLSDWSTCNRMCQGMKYRKAECRSTEHKEAVPDAYCRNEEKPQEESQKCNAHCTLQWQMTSMSECSNHCGPGVRTVTSRCVQILLDSSHPPRPIPAHACLHIEKPSEHQSCVGPCDDAHWSYSEWNACSVSCGGGVQLRSAICVDSNERQVRDENCVRQEKHLKRTCNQEACPKWDLGEWSSCSVTCGVGKRHRASWCQVENRVVSRTFCSGTPIVTTEACDAGPCHQWHAGDWSPCSVTCGEGTSRRNVVCKNADGAPSDGCSISEKPETSVTCTLKPCPNVVSLPPITYSTNPPREDSFPQENEIDSNGITFHSGYKWHVGAYGECSRKCNIGYKNRIARCISSETGMVAPDYYCDSNQQPIVRIACNPHPCPTWNTGDWSECDAVCGNGFQHRQIRCQSHRGETLPDKECNDEQPKHVRRCQKESCRSNPKSSRENSLDSNIVRRWKMSNWTPCSKSCGTGIQTRRVECTMRRSNHWPEVPVKDEQCLRTKPRKPKSQRLCQRVACDFIWQEGTWSECSAECGEGMQRRAVTCHRVNLYGWIDPTPTEGCPMDQRPVSEQICKLRECSDEYYWTVGPWKKCSQSCGRKGRQIRRLYCHNAAGNTVARIHCPAEYKPQRKRKCNQRKCGPVTCLEIQKRLKVTTDGEYPLLIGGRNMTIYCHGMSSAEPREYLTLPAGDSENFAEIYDKRLRNPHTCPFNGQRNDSCNCVSELGTISGRTMFKRVRIDPTTLYIIANDYTFSWTKGMQRVEYGKAGDCYSLTECPQGRFSIDLRGTALGLSPEITWIKETSSAFLAINRINNQRIIGKCGGYCGFCKPRTGLKLDVLPP